MDIARFLELPLMGILRGVTQNQCIPLLEAIEASGLKTVEFTMNTEGAAEMIKKASRIFTKHLVVGAGTVLTMGHLQTALDSGASFIVMPVVIPEVMAYCIRKKVPVFPGALCPQEIYAAWQAGATMVKIFPSKFFGPEYFKEIKAPFNEVKLLACSGVTPDNLKDYFQNGASAAAIGSSVFRKEWIDQKKFDTIGSKIREYIRAYQAIGA